MRRAVVFDEEPVALVGARSRRAGPAIAIEEVRHEQRDQLLRVLVGPVVVGASGHDHRAIESRGVGERPPGRRPPWTPSRERRAGARASSERAHGDRAVDLVGRDVDEPLHRLCRRAASRRTPVPITLVSRNTDGAAIERSTWLSAAKCTMMSWSIISCSTRSRVTDVAGDKSVTRSSRSSSSAVAVDARISQRVEVGHRRLRLSSPSRVADEVGADESGAAGDQIATSHTGRRLVRRTRRAADGGAPASFAERRGSPVEGPGDGEVRVVPAQGALGCGE